MAMNAHDENKLTLTNILGLAEEQAERLLSDSILITFENDDLGMSRLVGFLRDILSRTFSDVTTEYKGNPSVEIILGNRREVSNAKHIFASFNEGNTVVISDSRQTRGSDLWNLHDAFQITVACYIAAFTMRRLVGHMNSELPFPAEVRIDFGQLYPDQNFLNSKLDIGKVHLAGAGAIGNAFLYALQTFDVVGVVRICDGDKVSTGNLNRCLWFDVSHLGTNKAIALAQTAQMRFPHLKLDPHEGMLSTLPERVNGGKWLERLVVAVDSRRARRNLNSEIPREVFDASTTDIREVFLHFHRRPLNGAACLECAYYLDELEKAHETHIAQVLGLQESDIEQLIISADAAAKIARKYQQYDARDLEGQAYDSLFKELCGKGSIIDKDDAQVVAPFAFVSVLGGALLAIEFVRRIATHAQSFNSWRLSPWTSPVQLLRQHLPTNAKCSFCSNLTKSAFAEAYWKSQAQQGSAIH